MAAGEFRHSCGGIMRASMCLMTGIAFCFGMLIGTLVRLPAVAGPGNAASLTLERHPRNILHLGRLTESDSIDTQEHYINNSHKDLALKVHERLPERDTNHISEQTLIHKPEKIHLVSGVNRNSNGAQNDKGLTKSTIVSRVPNVEHRLDKLSDVTKGILWSKQLKNMCPGGFSENVISAWRKQVEQGKVVHLTEGCGRMQNRLLTLQDSSKACARYRPNIDQIQGEIYSYHLAKVLGINNVLPTALTIVKSVEPQWDHVDQEIAMSQWADDKFVVLTQWVENLEAAYIPKEFQTDERSLNPTDRGLLNKSISELCELVQWSDLIVFDYLTANLDRVVNNMFNQQWNSQMMASPAHNLERDKTSGRLVFLDNESGLLHGYRLLEKYAPYHEALLESLCVFTESTAKSVEKLFLDNNIGEELQKSLVLSEVYHEQLPRFPDRNAKILNQRLSKIYDKIQRCRMQYDNR